MVIMYHFWLFVVTGIPFLLYRTICDFCYMFNKGRQTLVNEEKYLFDVTLYTVYKQTLLFFL